jgi:AcrR family transcriptional regulator
MGINDRKIKELEIKKNDIITAAEKVFFTKGYDAATMDDVAREAEFSKRTVYVYFNSKEQIYFEIMIRGYRLLIQMLESDLDARKPGNAIEKIQQLSVTLYEFSQEYADYFNAIMEYENSDQDFQNGVPAESRDECYALGEKILGYLSDSLKWGVEEGIFRADLDVQKTALILWACTNGVFNTAKTKEKYLVSYHHTTSQELVTFAFNLLLDSLLVKNGGNSLES